MPRPSGLSGAALEVMKLNNAMAIGNSMRSLLYNQLNQLLGYSEAMPWQKGQSGNPGGLSKGSRRKLTDAFIRALARDWKAHGEEVIERVRHENPAAYFKGMLSLVQKDVSVEGQISQMPVQSEPLSATVAFVKEMVREQEKSLEGAQPAKDDSETAV